MVNLSPMNIFVDSSVLYLIVCIAENSRTFFPNTYSSIFSCCKLEGVAKGCLKLEDLSGNVLKSS